MAIAINKHIGHINVKNIDQSTIILNNIYTNDHAPAMANDNTITSSISSIYHQKDQNNMCHHANPIARASHL